MRFPPVLKQRVITAVVLAVVAIAAISLLPPLGLAWLFGAAVLVAMWEWSRLADLRAPAWRAAYCTLGALLLIGLAKFTGLPGAVPQLDRLRDLLAVAVLWWAIALLWVKGYPGSAALWGTTALRMVMGLLTLLPAWLALMLLRVQPHGQLLILFLVALVAAADIGAFFAGRALGRHKLAPRVSPGKSWEGLAGGVVGALLFALLVWSLAGRGGQWLTLPALLAIATATVLASVLGDLAESMVKRHCGVKDSGSLLPGHGGVLDRLDSLTAAAPVFALGLLLALG